MFGSRRDEGGTWRLCERRGRLITHVWASEYPEIEIKFEGRDQAEACAEALNEAYWSEYAPRRRDTEDQGVKRGMLETILHYGGLSSEEFGRMFA